MNSFIITGTGITVFIADDSSQHTIKNDHPRYADICRMAADDDFAGILIAIDVRAAVDNFIYNSDNGRFTIEDGVLSFDGNSIHSTLADRMIDMAVAGLELTAMENFMVNLMSNPSFRAVTELYSFLEVGKLPITTDGHFLAYKKVTDGYTDCHTGKMDNSIGATVSMVRNQVNENRDETCSSGLHFCSYDYLNKFGGQRVVVLKINPRDVVSIPSDYNDTKGRCCQYEVIRELESWHSTLDEADRIEGAVSDFGFYLSDDDFDDCDETCFYCDEEPDECTCEECPGCHAIVTECGDCDCELLSDDDDDDGDNDDGDNDDPIGYTPWPEDMDDSDEIDAANYTAPATGVIIKALDMRNTVTYRFDSIEDAHAETGVPIEYIKRVLKGQKGSSLGYIFSEENV